MFLSEVRPFTENDLEVDQFSGLSAKQKKNVFGLCRKGPRRCNFPLRSIKEKKELQSRYIKFIYDVSVQRKQHFSMTGLFKNTIWTKGDKKKDRQRTTGLIHEQRVPKRSNRTHTP